MAEIENMFYQVRVKEEDQDFLRFLWWPKGDMAMEPEEYCLTVHLFGAGSSPGCPNFALKRAAHDTTGTVNDFAHDSFSRPTMI